MPLGPTNRILSFARRDIHNHFCRLVRVAWAVRHGPTMAYLGG
jgi:hypothetical protein